MGLKRIAVVGLAVILTGLMGAAVAQASPGSGGNSEIIDLQCQDLGAVQVVVSNTSDHANENAPAWGTGRIVGSNTVLIPFSFDFQGTFTPSDNSGSQPVSFSLAKGHGGAAPNGNFDTCTFQISETSPEGSFEATGTVVGLIPAGFADAGGGPH